MVTRLSGIGDEGAAGLGALVDAVGQLLNPNAKFEQALKGMFLEKPELMQKFVDVEKANPGTLKAFGFSDSSTDILSRMTESIPALKARKMAPEIAAVLQEPVLRRSTAVSEVTGKSEAQIADEELALFMNNTIRPLLKDGQSDIAVEMMRKRYGLMSPGEKAKDTAAATTAAPVAAADIAQANLITQTTGAAFKPEELTGRDFGADAKKFLDGKLSADIPFRYNVTPGAKEAFQQAIQGELAKRNDMAQRGIASLRIGQQQAQTDDDWARIGSQLFRENEGIGTPSAWTELSRNPEAVQARMQQLAANPSSAQTLQDQAYLQIYNRLQAQGKTQFSKELSNIRKEYGANLKILDETTDPTQKGIALQNLNEALRQQATLTGGRQIEAYERTGTGLLGTGAFKREHLEFRYMDTGAPAEAPDFALGTGPSGGGSSPAATKLSPAESQALELLTSGKATLDQLMQDTTKTGAFKARVAAAFKNK